jgi:hypothetical protein
MNNSNEYQIGKSKFSQLVGVSPEELPVQCIDLLVQKNLSYRIAKKADRDQIILEILQKLNTDVFDPSGAERRGKWEKGWNENLSNFLSDGKLEELIPKYYRPDHIIRIDRDYAYSDNTNIVFDFFQVFRLWLFLRFLDQTGDFFEFGCGSAHNLPVVSELYPGKRVHGLDWTESSVQIVERLAKQKKLPLEGHLFDLFKPDYGLVVPGGSSFFTFGCLEQLGDKHGKFIDFILKKRPQICVNVEPIDDFYDTNNLSDYLAYRYHETRNYLHGYLTALETLQQDGKVEIIQKQRVCFSAKYHEGWSFIAWKPL